MVQLITGLKGSGKTKRLVDMVRAAVNEETGDVELGFDRCGRKPGLTKAQLAAIQKILAKDPSTKMRDLHERLHLPCTLRALYYIVKKMGVERANAIREPKKKNALPVWKGRAYLW